MPPRKGTTTVSIVIPSTYELPEFYTTAPPDVIAEALRIGATLYETLKEMKVDEGNAALAELEAKKQTDIARIREQANTNLKQLQEQLTESDVAYTTLQKQQQERLASAVLSERNTAKATYEAQVQRQQETITSLQHRIQLATAERDADIQKAEERTKAALELALKEKERTIERQQLLYDKLNATLEKNSEELSKLREAQLAKRLQNSKAKGDEYEAIFREKLIHAYGTGPHFSVEETAKNGFGHQADLIMNWDTKQILWEVKNYDYPVPTKEVDKFHRDMNENSTISIGVMVSRYTHITGKNSSGSKHIEFLNDKMYIYLNNFDAMSEDTLPGLMLLFKTYWLISRNFESQETIETAVRMIEKLHGDAVKAKTEWKQHKSHNEAMVRWMAETVERTEASLKSALQMLQGGVTKEKLVIPPRIFRDVTDEKAMECIRHVLEVTTVSKDESCVLNDVAQAVSERMGLARDTVRDNIRGLLLDAAFIPNKGKNPARIQGLQLKSTSSAI